MVTVIEEASFDHMPDSSNRPSLEGKTLREVLATLRQTDFGNIGGMSLVKLSDGTMLSVELEKASMNSCLMNSQRACRYEFQNGWPKKIRSYKL